MYTTVTETAQVIALLQSGMRQFDIAWQLNLNCFDLRRVLQRFRETHRWHRPKTIALLMRNRFSRTPFSSLDNSKHLYGQEKVTRTVNCDPGTCYRPGTDCTILQGTIAVRPCEHINWTVEPRRTVLFSDKTRMCLLCNDRRRKVHRRQGEWFAQSCIEETVEYGVGSCMFWGWGVYT